MPDNEQLQRYIRIELPTDATPEEIAGLEKAVTELAEKFSEDYDYDIPVGGGAWYPPVESSTEPLPVALSKLRPMLFVYQADSRVTDAAVLHAHLQKLQELGMSQLDLQIHLERERAINSVVLRNMRMEKNLLVALDMVTGNVANPRDRIAFQPGTQ